MKYILVLFLLGFCSWGYSQNNPASWNAVQKTKKGEITVYWYDNNPFNYLDENGKLKGLEVEIINGFQTFLFNQYGIAISFNWVQLNSFVEVLNEAKNQNQVGAFSLGGFSITDERKMFMKFSPSYMEDIAVFLSTPDIPIVSSPDELKTYLSNGTAIGIPGTTQEKDLLNLRTELGINFKMKQVSNSFDFITAMHREHRRAFGYLSLPVYLMKLNDGSLDLKRQNYFTRKKQGHGIGIPPLSDWDIPMNEFFKSDYYLRMKNALLGHYLNMDLYDFINSSASDPNLTILTQEREIQKVGINLQSLVIQKERKRNIILVIVVLVITMILFVIVILIRRLIRDLRNLRVQKEEIEMQSEQLKIINNNLEKIISARSQDLQKKRFALEQYSSITGNLLKEPLREVISLVAQTESFNLLSDDQILITLLKKSASNLQLVIESVTKQPPK